MVKILLIQELPINENAAIIYFTMCSLPWLTERADLCTWRDDPLILRKKIAVRKMNQLGMIGDSNMPLLPLDDALLRHGLKSLSYSYPADVEQVGNILMTEADRDLIATFGLQLVRLCHIKKSLRDALQRVGGGL